MKQDGRRCSAGAIVMRETADGARFLLVHRQGEWRFPVALADDVERAVAAALADARTAAAVSGRPTRLPGTYSISGERVDGAAGTGATVFVLATVSRDEPAPADEPAPVARATEEEVAEAKAEAEKAEAEAEPEDRPEPEPEPGPEAESGRPGSQPESDGVSNRQGCWVTLDEGLQLIAGRHRGALVWAAARVMHEATLARPESRQRPD